MKKHITYLEKLNACFEAIEWAEQFKTMQEAWDNCEQGDWMMWLLGKQINTVKSRKKLVLTTCTCVRLSLEHVPKDEKRPLKAIETAEKWARNDKSVSLENVRITAYAANAAYITVDTGVDAVYAVYAAARVANSNTIYVAGYADAAIDAVADAIAEVAEVSDVTYNYDVKNKVLKKCADIVRKDYPKIRMIK